MLCPNNIENIVFLITNYTYTELSYELYTLRSHKLLSMCRVFYRKRGYEWGAESGLINLCKWGSGSTFLKWTLGADECWAHSQELNPAAEAALDQEWRPPASCSATTTAWFFRWPKSDRLVFAWLVVTEVRLARSNRLPDMFTFPFFPFLD